jgi:hypothetical protein
MRVPLLIAWVCLLALASATGPVYKVPVVVGPFEDSTLVESDLEATIATIYRNELIPSDRIGSLEIDRIVLSSDPLQDRQLVEDYLAVHRNVDIAFAIVITSNPFVPAQFSGVRILVEGDTTIFACAFLLPSFLAHAVHRSSWY